VSEDSFRNQVMIRMVIVKGFSNRKPSWRRLRDRSNSKTAQLSTSLVTSAQASRDKRQSGR
jgi:hypothetical protein